MYQAQQSWTLNSQALSLLHPLKKYTLSNEHMKKNISKIVLVFAFAATLACASGCGSTRTENGVNIKQGNRLPWF